MKLGLIAAVAKNGVIGKAGALPWHLPEDLAWFKAQTQGKPIIMGHTTFSSLGRVLPGREHIVLSRQAAPTTPPPHVHFVASWTAALSLAQRLSDQEAMVIGGRQIYSLALPYVDRIYLTEIDLEADGDTCFPAWPRDEFEEIERHRQRSQSGLSYATVIFARRSCGA